MRSILERAIVHLLNEETDKAEALFHKFIVEKARGIHESLRNDDVELNEFWNSEVDHENYMTDTDLSDEGSEDEDLSDAGEYDDVDADHDEELADADEDSEDADLDAEDGDLEDASEEERLSDIEDQIAKLSDEFERLMAEIDSDEDHDEHADDDDEDLGDETEELSDEDHDVEASDEDADEDADEGDEYEDLSDITESVLAELEKVSTVEADDKEAAAGKTVPMNKKSNLPSNGSGNRGGAAPVKTKQAAHASFERETPPATKPMKKAKNVKDSAEKFLSKVPAEGDKSAALNKDFAGVSPKKTKSPVDGK